jgi:hypothetical protein
MKVYQRFVVVLILSVFLLSSSAGTAENQTAKKTDTTNCHIKEICHYCAAVTDEMMPAQKKLYGEYIRNCQQPDNKVKPQTYQQWRASLPENYPTTTDYMRVMSKFVKYCDEKSYWNGSKFYDPEGGDITNTYAVMMACLVADPDYDATICGLSKDNLKDRLHIAVQDMSGSGWAAVYGCSYRAAMALCVAESEMTAEDVNDLKNHILTNRDARSRVDTDGWVQQAGMSAENDSWPLGARGMFPAFFPDHAEYDWRFEDLQEDWVRLVCTLDMNDNTTMVGSPAKPLNQWTDGVNINADHTFDNHFYIHVGYMHDTLHLIGTVWTVFNEKGHSIPTTFYWNEPNIYNNFLRFLHLWDGRNFYVAGTDWVMYQYGNGSELIYYSGKKFRDNDKVAASVERGIFAHFEWRQKFLDGDLSGFSAYNPGDPLTGNFSQCAYDFATSYFLNLVNCPWTGGFATEAEINARANGNFRSWVSAYTITNRTDHRLAKAGYHGWAVIPRGGDHMGSWENSSVGGTSSGNFEGNYTKFDSGFATTKTSSFTALPDDKSVLIIEQSTPQAWKIGNWLFNDEKRTAYYARGSIVYDRTGKSGSILSSWFNVDNKIGYIDMQNSSAIFSALEDDIDPGAANTYWPGRYIGYVKFTHTGKGLLIIADVNSAETQDYVTAGNYQLPTTGQSESGAAVLKGQDGDWYLVLSNFSSSAQTVSTTLPFAPASYESVTGQSLSIVGADVSASLAGYTTGVFRAMQRHAGYVQRRFDPETGLFRSPPGFDRQPSWHHSSRH